MEFKQIPGHRQYAVSECGVVVRTDGGRDKTKPLKQSFHKVTGKEYPNGYNYCMLLTEDYVNELNELVDMPTMCNKSVHRIVAISWIGTPPNGQPWVNHKDGNKLNNHVSNLEWSSISQNIQHAHDTGLRVVPKGVDHWRHGKAHNKKAKRLMAAAKMGEKHPKFKGWWVVNGHKFASTGIAATSLKTYPKAIERMCKAKKNGCYFLDKSKLIQLSKDQSNIPELIIGNY